MEETCASTTGVSTLLPLALAFILDSIDVLMLLHLAPFRTVTGPPRKRFMVDRGQTDSREAISRQEVERSDEEERRDSDDEREDSSSGGTPANHCDARAVKNASNASHAAAPAALRVEITTAKPAKGVILRSGRIRLPDKLIQYLNNSVSKSLYWQPDGQGFSIDCETVQADLLDKYFHGSKLSSFLRSLNRW